MTAKPRKLHPLLRPWSAGLAVATVLLFLAVQVESATPVRRDVLALYKSSEHRNEENCEIHELLELPLNFLGFRVTYADAEAPLPGPEAMRRYRAVVTWFQADGMRAASRYRRWLANQLDAGKRVIILGSFGANFELGKPESSRDRQETRRIFARFGVVCQPEQWVPASRLKLLWRDPKLAAFERDVATASPAGLVPIHTADSRVKAIITYRGDPPLLGAFLSPKGGYVAPELAYVQLPGGEEDFKTQWYIDPIRFLSEALGCAEEPKLDFATLFGRRLFFSQVDGDGLTSDSQIKPNYLCGDVIREEILVPTPLPFTASLIQARVDPEVLGSVRDVELARRIFSLPNVEPASHSFAHPFDWRTGDLLVSDIPGYSHLDADKEIFGSLHFVTHVILQDRDSCNVFLWTGMCNPGANLLRKVNEHNIRALNGGRARVYPDAPSISNFSAAFHHVGEQIQYNMRAANDYEFTNHWRGPFDGFREVITTFEVGWDKYPLVPIDLYFHYYSGERKKSLRALKEVVAWVRDQPICPVTAGQYVDMARDFLHAEVAADGPNTWLVHTGGFLRTVRFDTDTLVVDLAHSSGVLGFVRKRGYLYVHLDEGQKHRITLAPASQPLEQRPHVVESSNLIRRWEAAANATDIRFEMYGFGTSDVFLAGLQPAAYYKVANPSSRQVTYASSDSSGFLRLRVPVQGWAPVELSLTTRHGYLMSYGRYGVLMLVIVLLSIYSLAMAKKQARKLAQEEDVDELVRRRRPSKRTSRRSGR